MDTVLGHVKAAAIMTAGRSENTVCRNWIERGLRPLGIPLTVGVGVYYGQCMQKMLEELASTDCQYAITVDGDTMFSTKQLQRLLSIIVKCDEIDAIAGIQVRRGMPTMLGTVEGGKVVGEDALQIEWTGYPLKAKTAHFGLTVIDLAKLRNVEKPWFAAHPNEAGGWDGEKVDDDVHFWLQWTKAGNTIYIDPGTRLGHMEEMVAIHDEKLNTVHMYQSEWAAKYAC